MEKFKTTPEEKSQSDARETRIAAHREIMHRSRELVSKIKQIEDEINKIDQEIFFLLEGGDGSEGSEKVGVHRIREVLREKGADKKEGTKEEYNELIRRAAEALNELRKRRAELAVKARLKKSDKIEEFKKEGTEG